MPGKPDLTYGAPVLSVDLAGEDYQIWPCNDCLPWHAEVKFAGALVVREWHAAECPTLADLLWIAGAPCPGVE